MAKDKEPKMESHVWDAVVLLPCPFCGGAAVSMDTYENISVQCSECGVLMSLMPDPTTRTQDFWVDARGRWNKRTSAAEAEVARLHGALSKITRTDIKGPRSLTEARRIASAAINEVAALKNSPEIYCASCGHPRSDHPFRHAFIARL